MFGWVTDLVGVIFSPLMNLPIIWTILIISFCLSLMITLIYKFTTDQKLMKDLKDEIKAFQTQLKELRDKPEEMMAVQKKAMETNMKYMMHSLRPTIFTFIPIILIFGWLQSALAVAPLMPDQPFDIVANFDDATGSIEMNPKGLELLTEKTAPIVDNKATWSAKGPAGKYAIGFTYLNSSFVKDVLITEEQKYEPVTKEINFNKLKSISVAHEKLIVLNLFGWKLGWLGCYIIFSIIFSMSLRKLLKIY